MCACVVCRKLSKVGVWGIGYNYGELSKWVYGELGVWGIGCMGMSISVLGVCVWGIICMRTGYGFECSKTGLVL